MCLILWFYAELRLDLFKKTLSLPQVSMGFLQKKSSAAATLKARRIMKALQKVGTHQTQLALIEYSLKAKAVDFSKVLSQNFCGTCRSSGGGGNPCDPNLIVANCGR